MYYVVSTITRGHHGEGKHVREKKPRQSYGPRDPVKRAEWLKTDEGKAWAERRANANSGNAATGGAATRLRSGDQYVAAVDRIIREEQAITRRNGREAEAVAKRAHAAYVALNRADIAAFEAQRDGRAKARAWYEKAAADEDPVDRLTDAEDIYIRWTNRTEEGLAARRRQAVLDVRVAAAVQALDSAQAAQAKNAADAQYVRPEADRIRDRLHEVLLEKTPSFKIESDISATASLRGATIEGKALSFRIRAAEDFVTRIIAPKVVEGFDPTGVLFLGSDNATYARGKTFALYATKSADEGYGWKAADIGNQMRYEPTDKNRESCGYHAAATGAIKIAADRDYTAIRLSDIVNGYPRVVGTEIRNNRELRAAAQAALDRSGDLPVSTGPKPPIISVTARTTTDVLVHEIAHSIEHRSEPLAAARVDFMRRRTTNADGTRERVYWLRDVYGQSSGYESHEAARLDSFESAYVGKVYPQQSRSSEVFSMGVQRLYSDPAGFRAADPDFFRFTVAALKGVPEGSRRLPSSSKKWDTSNLTPLSDHEAYL